jgi:uncharacterized protein with HEPN domain
MAVSAADRLRHMKDSIANIRGLLEGRNVEQVVDDRVSRAALERFLEVLSEASRYVPDDWKIAFGPAIPWWEVAAFGNILRHEYDQVDLDVLWDVYARDLDPLEVAIDAMIAAHPSKDTSP